jgi:hypothetical protein
VDTELLVDSRIEDGRKLVDELVRGGFDVTVAFWGKTGPEGLWFLYIASPSVDPAKIGEAYRVVYACLIRLPDPSVTLSEVKVVHASNPVAVAAKAVRDQYPGRIATRFHAKRLADLSVEEAYIYPPPGVVLLAQGKEAVLEYLEREAQAKAGQTGQYLLARDDAGNLVAYIAGHSFIGTGTVTMGGRRMDVVDGIVVNVQ